MLDREKVIKALELCTSKIETRTQVPCKACSYHNTKYHGVLGDGCCNMRSLQLDCLALLKAQEPKLLTIEDFTPEKLRDIHHVWVEIRPGYYNADLDRCYGGKPYPAVVTRWCGIRCNSIGNVCQVWIPGGYESLFNVNNDYNTGYGVKWRCWTSRPTDEQREVTPWDG